MTTPSSCANGHAPVANPALPQRPVTCVRCDRVLSYPTDAGSACADADIATGSNRTEGIA